ncbi:MAG TPA: hypothetical protein VIL36_11765 [Acidimicrobiales bacterium]
MRSRLPWRASRAVLACGVALVVGGCVGTIDREDFNRTIQQRGGGVTPELPQNAVDAIADRLGVEDFAFRSLTINPPNELVVVDVRDPVTPVNLDTYTVRRGTVERVVPVRLSAEVDLDAETILVSTVAFDRLDEMADAAIAEFDRDGYVTSISATALDETATISMSLESDRASATARFTAAGDLIEVVRS